MPKCKNDRSEKYTGKEKSPQGRGYCASGEKLGKIKHGKDKKLWEVVKKWEKVKKKPSSSSLSSSSSSSSYKSSISSLKSSSSSSLRKKTKKKKNKKKNKKKKTKNSTKKSKATKEQISKYVKKIYDIIKKNSKYWWTQLSNNNKIVVIYKNDKAEWESTRVHKDLDDSNIKFILWLKHKDIGLDDFVRYVLNKVTIKHIEALVTRENPLEYILENNNIFLKKNPLGFSLTPSAIYHKSVFKEYKFDTFLKSYQDTYMTNNICLKYKSLYINKTIAIWKFDENSYSQKRKIINNIEIYLNFVIAAYKGKLIKYYGVNYILRWVFFYPFKFLNFLYKNFGE